MNLPLRATHTSHKDSGARQPPPRFRGLILRSGALHLRCNGPVHLDRDLPRAPVLSQHLELRTDSQRCRQNMHPICTPSLYLPPLRPPATRTDAPFLAVPALSAIFDLPREQEEFCHGSVRHRGAVSMATRVNGRQWPHVMNRRTPCGCRCRQQVVLHLRDLIP